MWRVIFFTLAFGATAFGRPFSLLVYNVENLFDADGVSVYEDYGPENYPPGHFAVKLANVAAVLARVDGGAGADIVVMSEIEVDQTPRSSVSDPAAWLEKHRGQTVSGLLSQSPLPRELAGVPAEVWLLKACEEAGLEGYSVAVPDESPGTYESGRLVGVKNVIFSRFPIIEVRTHPTLDARAILEVTLDIDGAPLIVFANHWKSGAGSLETEPIRVENAKTLRSRLDEIFAKNPNADVIVAGDLNSHYNQGARYRDMRETGIGDVLRSQGNEIALLGGRADLYNLWFELPSDQRGSDIFQNEWGTLMHIILSRGLYDYDGIQYQDNSFAVLKWTGMNADIFGRPIRWFRGSTPGGFSDHFPLYARFRRLHDAEPGRFLSLNSPSETESGDGEPLRVDVSPVDLLENAIEPRTLPPGTELRGGAFTGRVFKIDAPARIDSRGRIYVDVNGLEYVLYTRDRELRKLLRTRVEEKGRLAFFGELGKYRKEWQFVLHGKEWFPPE